MVDVRFLAHIIEATLVDTPFPQPLEATGLLLGTAATETCVQCMPQMGGGPACGVFQIEPVTAQDLHRFLATTAVFTPLLDTRCSLHGGDFDETALSRDLSYQVLLARTLYYVRDPHPLPAVVDVVEASKRWKQYYNTYLGAGTEEKYQQDYATFIAPYWPTRAAPISSTLEI